MTDLHPWRQDNARDAENIRRREVLPPPAAHVSFPNRVWEPSSMRDGVMLWASRVPGEDDYIRREELRDALLRVAA